MPLASASRGRWLGRADSLIRRLIDRDHRLRGGKQHQQRGERRRATARRGRARARRCGAAAARRRARRWRARPRRGSAGRATRGAAGPDAAGARLGAGRARGSSRRDRGRAASRRRRSSRVVVAARRRDDSAPRIRLEQRRRRPPARCVPLFLASCSIACSVWSRVSSRSAANAGEPASSAASARSWRPTMSGQSASPIERSDVIALPTLRLSAACAAGSRVWISARCGATRSSHSKQRAFSPRRAGSCRRCAICARNGLADAAPVEQGQHRVEALRAVGLEPVGSSRLATSRDALFAATRSASRRRFSIRTTRSVVGSAHSSPSVSSRDLLVRLQEMDEQVLVEGAVGVGDERPGDAVDRAAARPAARPAAPAGRGSSAAAGRRRSRAAALRSGGSCRAATRRPG